MSPVNVSAYDAEVGVYTHCRYARCWSCRPPLRAVLSSATDTAPAVRVRRWRKKAVQRPGAIPASADGPYRDVAQAIGGEVGDGRGRRRACTHRSSSCPSKPNGAVEPGEGAYPRLRRLHPRSRPARYPSPRHRTNALLEKAYTMLYCCSCASVGVPEKASNRSTPITPGSASIWLMQRSRRPGYVSIGDQHPELTSSRGRRRSSRRSRGWRAARRQGVALSTARRVRPSRCRSIE